jgi:hypothetical protein
VGGGGEGGFTVEGTCANLKTKGMGVGDGGGGGVGASTDMPRPYPPPAPRGEGDTVGDAVAVRDGVAVA